MRMSKTLLERYRSKQYELSKEILLIKHQKGLTTEEMSELSGLPKRKYLEFEGGYANHSVSDYLLLIDKLRREVCL